MFIPPAINTVESNEYVFRLRYRFHIQIIGGLRICIELLSLCSVIQVIALPSDGQSVSWRWVPPKSSNDVSSSDGGTDSSASEAEPLPRRPFFPSSICADSSGHVFIADLYNERVYMLDCSSTPVDPSGVEERTSATVRSSPLLTRRTGLRGGPLSLTVDDSKRQLYVADGERTIQVFCYSGAVSVTSRSRATSDCQEEADGNGLAPSKQQPTSGQMMTSSDRPFSYCADDTEEY